MKLKNVKRILIVNHHGIGDNIMMTPSVRALKQVNPELRLFLLVSGEYKAIKDLWSTNPYIEKVFASELSFHPKFWNPFLFYFKEYPLIKREAVTISRKLNADKIIIVRQQYLPEFIEKKIFFLPRHRIDRIAYELGVKLNDFHCDIFYQQKHKEKAEAFLEGHRLKGCPLIGLHTMPSNAGPRTWPLIDVKPFTEHLHKEFGFKFILFHDRKSYFLEKSLEEVQLNDKYVFSTYEEDTKEMDILTTSALVENCDVVVAIDSAIAYIANAVGISLVLLCHLKNPLEERKPKTEIVYGLNAARFTSDKVMELLIKILETTKHSKQGKK